MKDFLKRALAKLLMLAYLVVVIIGIVIIWKVSKGYYVNPIETTIGFVLIALWFFIPYLMYIVLPVLPKKKNNDDDEGDNDT